MIRPSALVCRVLLLAALLGSGCAASEGTPYSDVAEADVKPPTVTFDASGKAQLGHSDAETGTPDRVILPTLEVDAPIIDVGLNEDQAMEVPDNARDVAWWRDVKVGEGNALLAGHKDYRGRIGSFSRIGQLEEGDPVSVVTTDGRELTYYVEWVKLYDADIDATELLGDQGRPVLTLITCGGPFSQSSRHYTKRYVVRAGLPHVEPFVPAPDNTGFAL